MEIHIAAGSKIRLMTIDRTMAGGEQKHKIRWVPQPKCPDGYIIQRITRDTKTIWGKELTDSHGLPTGKIKWDQPKISRADYYELWEVWQGHVFPSKGGTATNTYHSHAGIQAAGWFGETYKDPALTQLINPLDQDPDDVYHDIFTDKVPACSIQQRVKGTNKILGKVYFFPRNERRQPKFLADYLEKGRRNLQFSGFTGGILLQLNTHDITEPDKSYLKITRYEAIGFEGSYSKQDIYDRKFPGIMRRPGQGVVNARNAKVTYSEGTSLGPAGIAVAATAE